MRALVACINHTACTVQGLSPSGFIILQPLCLLCNAQLPQEALAAGHRAAVLQKAALSCWAAYSAEHREKRQWWMAALLFCSRQLTKRALLRWRDVAHTAAALRRMEGRQQRGQGSEQAQQHRQAMLVGGRHASDFASGPGWLVNLELGSVWNPFPGQYLGRVPNGVLCPGRVMPHCIWLAIPLLHPFPLDCAGLMAAPTWVPSLASLASSRP